MFQRKPREGLKSHLVLVPYTELNSGLNVGVKCIFTSCLECTASLKRKLGFKINAKVL